MPFKFKFSALFVLTFLSVAMLTTPVQAQDNFLDAQVNKLANAPISAQIFNFGEENNNASPSPSQNADDQEAGGIEGMIKGSLLGKLLFNMPFEKAALVDIIALLAVAFMISKFISRANTQKTQGNPDNREFDAHSSSGSEGHEGHEGKGGPAAPPAGFDPWARLRSKQATPKKGKTIPFPGTEDQAFTHPHQEEFYVNTQSEDSQGPEDNQGEDEFLKGAKMLYARMHEAWKNQNLEFIQHFSSPQVFNIFQARSQNPDKHDFIDIVKVDAKVLKEEVRNGERYIVVEFNALAHKSKQAGPPSEIKETWAFLEPTQTGTWRLEEML